MLLLLGKCQDEIKQTKASNMANEMKVRRDLCDFYEKERAKHDKNHQKAIKKLRDDFAMDLDQQLRYQKEALDGTYNASRDPSLMSFESHENDVEKQELQDELDRLKRELAEKDALIKQLQRVVNEAA